jgi:exodeoxyribonuclease VII large subunit
VSDPDLFSQPSSDEQETDEQETDEQETDEQETGDRTVLSVTELTRGLSDLVEAHYDDVWVEGELSNFSRAASGHCYFTLKDEDAQIRCVMWRHLTKHVYFEPEDGMQVRVHGNASVYERRGDLQILAQSMRKAGKGAQQKEYERLKEKLKEEGLFETVRKKALPSFPETIGVVTSGQGAALHDIQSVLERRFPAAHVVLCPVPVQGMDAPQAIADAIAQFNAVPDDDPQRPEVLIVGRGGGSAEDLWAFNEEVVARAIADSVLPVVSAVGHESDVTIADFVADERAATPSMAAEVVVPDRRDVEMQVRTLHDRLHAVVERQVQDGFQRVDRLTSSRAFHTPVQRLEQMRQTLDALTDRLHRSAAQIPERARARCDRLRSRLQAVDPEQPLRRGYALIERGDAAVHTAADLASGDRVTLRFHDGGRSAEILPESAPDD